MSKEAKQQIHRVYGTINGVTAAVAGLCLMVACVGICAGGEHPFSAEAVQQAFSPIALPVYLCLALVLGGFVLEITLPVEDSRLRPLRSSYATLQHLLRTRTPGADPQLLKLLSKLWRCRLLRAAAMAMLGLLPLVYCLNPTHIYESSHQTVLQALYVLLPCLAAALCIYLVSFHRLQKYSAAAIPLVKALPAGAEVPRKDLLPAVQGVVIALALVLLVWGAVTGGTADVLTKAVNICRECVGLG